MSAETTKTRIHVNGLENRSFEELRPFFDKKNRDSFMVRELIRSLSEFERFKTFLKTSLSEDDTSFETPYDFFKNKISEESDILVSIISSYNLDQVKELLMINENGGKNTDLKKLLLARIVDLDEKFMVNEMLNGDPNSFLIYAKRLMVYDFDDLFYDHDNRPILRPYSRYILNILDYEYRVSPTNKLFGLDRWDGVEGKKYTDEEEEEMREKLDAFMSRITLENVSKEKIISSIRSSFSEKEMEEVFQYIQSASTHDSEFQPKEFSKYLISMVEDIIEADRLDSLNRIFAGSRRETMNIKPLLSQLEADLPVKLYWELVEHIDPDENPKTEEINNLVKNIYSNKEISYNTREKVVRDNMDRIESIEDESVPVSDLLDTHRKYLDRLKDEYFLDESVTMSERLIAMNDLIQDLTDAYENEEDEGIQKDIIDRVMSFTRTKFHMLEQYAESDNLISEKYLTATQMVKNIKTGIEKIDEQITYMYQFDDILSVKSSLKKHFEDFKDVKKNSNDLDALIDEDTTSFIVRIQGKSFNKRKTMETLEERVRGDVSKIRKKPSEDFNQWKITVDGMSQKDFIDIIQGLRTFGYRAERISFHEVN